MNYEGKNGKPISWETYSKASPDMYMYNPREQVNVACPKCGAKIYRRNDITLTTYPPQYRYECDACGWWGSAFI